MGLFKQVTHEKTEFLRHSLESGMPLADFTEYQDVFSDPFAPAMFANHDGAIDNPQRTPFTPCASRLFKFIPTPSAPSYPGETSSERQDAIRKRRRQQQAAPRVCEGRGRGPGLAPLPNPWLATGRKKRIKREQIVGRGLRSGGDLVRMLHHHLRRLRRIAGCRSMSATRRGRQQTMRPPRPHILAAQAAAAASAPPTGAPVSASVQMKKMPPPAAIPQQIPTGRSNLLPLPPPPPEPYALHRDAHTPLVLDSGATTLRWGFASSAAPFTGLAPPQSTRSAIQALDPAPPSLFQPSQDPKSHSLCYATLHTRPIPARHPGRFPSRRRPNPSSPHVRSQPWRRPRRCYDILKCQRCASSSSARPYQRRQRRWARCYRDATRRYGQARGTNQLLRPTEHPLKPPPNPDVATPTSQDAPTPNPAPARPKSSNQILMNGISGYQVNPSTSTALATQAAFLNYQQQLQQNGQLTMQKMQDLKTAVFNSLPPSAQAQQIAAMQAAAQSNRTFAQAHWHPSGAASGMQIPAGANMKIPAGAGRQLQWWGGLRLP
ncbi:hypothetical protein D9611_010726 [Ephemerocybe angulata]|uniref:Uncharacterized protein n=1 Tax=Ephemerocybe angulata TaxID=980116 RepID=A0A8H5BDL0_9AGAR|nr:hypothetical protein D9611_010726 [Tulosesus angulatus]